LLYNGIIVVPQQFKDRILDKYYAPALPTQPPAYPPVLNIKKVVLDPGHGGNDPGAIGRSGIREKDINLDIARRLEKLLNANGIHTLWTRSTDRFISLEERAHIANQSGADLFISVHTNASRSRKLNGFEVYYITENVNDSSRALNAAKNYDLNLNGSSFYNKSLKLKAALWDMQYTQNRADSIALAQSICSTASQDMGLRILGVKGAPFYVLKGTTIPAVLIEVGFISNSSEEKYLKNGFYRQQIAEVIAKGILDYGKRYNLVQASSN